MFVDDYKKLIDSIEPLREQFSESDQLFSLLTVISKLIYNLNVQTQVYNDDLSLFANVQTANALHRKLRSVIGDMTLVAHSCYGQSNSVMGRIVRHETNQIIEEVYYLLERFIEDQEVEEWQVQRAEIESHNNYYRIQK